MALIMIKCPHTGRPVATGMQANDVKKLSNVARTVACDACGMLHAWWKQEAWLVDDTGRALTSLPAILRPARKVTS